MAESNKIFVGGLAHIDELKLREYFGKFGRILDVKVEKIF